MLGSGRGRWAVAQILILIQILYVQAIFEMFSLPFLHATPCQHLIKHLCKLGSDAPILRQRSVENLGVKRNSCWRKLHQMILQCCKASFKNSEYMQSGRNHRWRVWKNSSKSNAKMISLEISEKLLPKISFFAKRKTFQRRLNISLPLSQRLVALRSSASQDLELHGQLGEDQKNNNNINHEKLYSRSPKDVARD